MQHNTSRTAARSHCNVDKTASDTFLVAKKRSPKGLKVVFLSHIPMVVDAQAALMPRLPHPVNLINDLPVPRHPIAETSVGSYDTHVAV